MDEGIKMQAYLSDMKNMKNICDDFKKEILDGYFESGQSKDASNKRYFYTPLFRQLFNPIKRVIDASVFFNIEVIETNRDILKDEVHMLENRALSVDIFEKYVSDIKSVFSGAKGKIEYLHSILDETEINRINEAIHDFLERCYYSSVTMSVCAVESRLLNLMLSVRPEEERKLNSMTLGQLIREYISNKEQYKNRIPKKHEPLLDLCNTYRIFSVHPKGEEINNGVARAILNFSIEFLTDMETRVVEEMGGV